MNLRRRSTDWTKWLRRIRKALLVCGCLFVAAAASFALMLWLEQPAAFRMLSAVLWMESTPPNRSDLIYVLGGDYLVRVPFAAELYKLGYGQKVVVPFERMPLADKQLPAGDARQEHFTKASLRILQEHEVPAGDVEEWAWANGVGTTAEEIDALRGYVLAHPEVQSVVIVTSGYHMRRTHYVARRKLPWRVHIAVSGIDGPEWNANNWWLHPIGRTTVREECVKLLFYIPRYLFG